MTISEKNGFKKSQCIHLATIAASLALSHVSDVSCTDQGYVSPKASFFSAEHCSYPVDCAIKKEFVGPGGSSN